MNKNLLYIIDGKARPCSMSRIYVRAGVTPQETSAKVLYIHDCIMSVLCCTYMLTESYVIVAMAKKIVVEAAKAIKHVESLP